MDPQFWHDLWERNELGFHQASVNKMLDKHFEDLKLGQNSRVFVPLCGKSLDMTWLMAQGMKVVGVELSERAVIDYFDNLKITPEIQTLGNITSYSAFDTEIFAGDIFSLTAEMLGPIGAVYDRGALVALPPEMRRDYASHLAEVTNNAQQLLITFDADPSSYKAPPFYLSPEVIESLYAKTFKISTLSKEEVVGGLKGTPAKEVAWHLT